MTEAPPTSARAALRERRHRAILDAAAALMEETGGTEFSVEELAARADVSRRTVFNHFATFDDIVTTVCGDLLSTFLGSVFDELEARTRAPHDDATMFDELAHALTTTDLVTPMSHLTRLLGADDMTSPRRAAMVGRSFTEVSERMSARLLRHHPDADELDVRMLVGSLMSSTLVIHNRWHEQTASADDARSRALWGELVERMLVAARTGYGAAPGAPARPTPPDRPAPA